MSKSVKSDDFLLNIYSRGRPAVAAPTLLGQIMHKIALSFLSLSPSLSIRYAKREFIDA